MCAKKFMRREDIRNRKKLEPCLQFISSLKLPQREALMNTGTINAPI